MEGEQEGSIKDYSLVLASVPVWLVLVIPFTTGGPCFGGNDLGFDFGSVIVF